MVKIVMSSGHAKYVRGAEGPPPWGLDEVNEARRVVEAVAARLRKLGVEVVTYHDDVSQTQNENLERIVDFHNAQGPHDLDYSQHFNAYVPTSDPMGCEVLYVTQDVLAEDLSATMANAADFINRGPKFRDDLFFLNNTINPAVLSEMCFVDSKADVELYHAHFDALCEAIATTLAGRDSEIAEKIPEVPEPPKQLDIRVAFSGKCSYFGGPNDTGVSPDEDLAWWDDESDAKENPHLFLPNQPPGTTGLARRLNPSAPYIACRWDYDVTSKSMLADPTLRALVRNKKNGLQALAWPADWGPSDTTGRVADLSPGLMLALQLETDDEVDVVYPAPILISSEDIV
jgi:N-acetylmuramoyl-L-alanine amidase